MMCVRLSRPRGRVLLVMWRKSVSLLSGLVHLTQRLLQYPLLDIWKRGSIDDLFTHGTQSTTVTNNSLLCLKTKSSALLDRALWVARVAKSTLNNLHCVI